MVSYIKLFPVSFLTVFGCLLLGGCGNNQTIQNVSPKTVFTVDANPIKNPVDTKQIGLLLTNVQSSSVKTGLQNAIDSKTSVQQVSFTSKSVKAAGLQGWRFSNGAGSQVILMNPTNQTAEVDVNPVIQDTSGRFEQEGMQENHQVPALSGGVATGRISLPPFSVTRLY